MSWSIKYSGLTAGDVHAKLLGESSHLPQQIKSYVVAGVTGLVSHYGDGVRVDVEGAGHLCDGPGSYEITTASLEVRKSDAATEEHPAERGADPTIDQWVAVGYRAENYKYTVSTPEVIAVAVQAEKDRDAERDRLAQEADRKNRELEEASKPKIVHLEADADYRERILVAAKAAGAEADVLAKINVSTGTGLDAVGDEHGVARIRP